MFIPSQLPPTDPTPPAPKPLIVDGLLCPVVPTILTMASKVHTGKWCHTSVSQLSKVLSCPAQLYADKMLSLSDGATDATNFGHKAHELLEYYLTGCQVEDTTSSPELRAVKLLTGLNSFPSCSQRPMPLNRKAACHVLFIPETKSWFAFANGKPVAITQRDPRNLGGTIHDEPRAYLDTWAKYHPIEHPCPYDRDFAVEWHISHAFSDRFSMPIEGFIDYWEFSKDGSVPDRIFDHKFKKYSDRFPQETQESITHNVQLLMYAHYVFTYFPRNQDYIVIGQHMYDKGRNVPTIVESTVSRYYVENAINKLTPAIDLVYDISRETEFKNVPINAKTGIGTRTYPCFQYGRMCPAVDLCLSHGYSGRKKLAQIDITVD